MRPPIMGSMALQTENLNRTQQGGVVAGSAAIMFAAAATTEGLFSGVIFVAAIVTILSALALYGVAYRERKN
jgi:high-affinity K+ transport system ATPase subunit B